MKEKIGLIFFGNIVWPPYNVRRSAGRVYVNETEVYPLRAGQPSLMPMPEGEEPPDLDFELDEITKKALDEGLSRVREIERYEEKADELTSFLKGKGVNTYKDENYGDVMIDTGKGWGVMVLFNEEARIALAREAEGLVTERRIPYDDAAQFSSSLRAALDGGDLVILDEGTMTVKSSDEAKRTRLALKEVSGSDALKDNKVNEIVSILGITGVSAKKLLKALMGH
jgi:hypothetical protein